MKLSVITINLNNAEGLRRTLESVLSQTCKDFEYVVVDGASTDGSVSLIDRFAEQLVSAGMAVITRSEPDSGLYNAMNKGVRLASGDYVLMLNSGDYFVNDRVVADMMPHLDGTDIVQGNIIRLREGASSRDCGYGRSDISFIDVQQGHFLHQASFCKRDLFERFGFFDESYKIDGDTVFYIKALGYGDAGFKYVDQDIAYFEQGGRSSRENKEWQRIRREEYRRWSTEMFSKRLWDTCVECDKKARLYDKLKRHPLAWKSVMLLVRLINLFEK